MDPIVDSRVDTCIRLVIESLAIFEHTHYVEVVSESKHILAISIRYLESATLRIQISLVRIWTIRTFIIAAIVLIIRVLFVLFTSEKACICLQRESIDFPDIQKVEALILRILDLN